MEHLFPWAIQEMALRGSTGLYADYILLLFTLPRGLAVHWETTGHPIDPYPAHLTGGQPVVPS